MDVFAGQGVSGSFWSQRQSHFVKHELGHGLGLLHTFNDFVEDDNDNPNNELVLVDGMTDCDCNCHSTGDFICDTPVDPFSSFDSDWYSAMFSNNSNVLNILNTDNELDACGRNYLNMSAEDQSIMLRNVMGYHPAFYSDPYISEGQATFVKIFNENKLWNTNANAGVAVMCPGPEIISPTTWTDSKKVFTSDIVINSKLTVKKSDLRFQTGVKVIINPGGQLILDNSHMDRYFGGECMEAADLWGGIEVSGDDAFTIIELKNGSTIRNVEGTVINVDNAKVLIGVKNGSRIESSSDAINVNNSLVFFDFNRFYMNQSYISGNINTTLCSGAMNSENMHFDGGSFSTITLNGVNGYFGKDCVINAKVTVNNTTGLQNIRVQDCQVEQELRISNNSGISFIRENTFGLGGYLVVGNVLDFDIGNNIFTSDNHTKMSIANGLLNENSNLIIQNEFTGDGVGMRFTGENSQLNLDCNDLSENYSADWDIPFGNGTFALEQGGPQLAAGNKFSDPALGNIGNLNFGFNFTYFYQDLPNEDPMIFGSGGKQEVDSENESKCDWPYPYLPYPSYCYNGMQDGDETGVDCGGSCKPCRKDIPIPTIPTSTLNCNDNGIQDNGEDGVDCGGLTCPPCDMFQNHCSDGVQNYDETGIDCGGSCSPCWTEFLGCNNGVLDDGESDVDCGGICPECDTENQSDLQDDLDESTSEYISDVESSIGVSMDADNISIQPELAHLDELLDHGSTEDLINYVNDYSSTESESVVQVLKETSPYVSAPVLHTVLRNSLYFSKEEFLALVKLNKGLMHDPYIAFVIAESGAYSDEQVKSVGEVHDKVSNLRTELLSHLQVKKQLMHIIVREQLDAQLSAINPNWKEIRTLLHKKDDRNTWYQIYESYISQSQYTLASAYLNSVDIESESDPFFKKQFLEFKKLNAILMQHYYAGNRKLELSGTVMKELQNIATQCYGIASMKARSVLLNYGIRTEITDCDKYAAVEFKKERAIKRRTESQEIVQIFPNPTKSSVEILIHEYNEHSSYDMRVIDISGKLILTDRLLSKSTMIDMSSINQGLYFIHLYENDQLLTKEKIIKLEK